MGRQHAISFSPIPVPQHGYPRPLHADALGAVLLQGSDGLQLADGYSSTRRAQIFCVSGSELQYDVLAQRKLYGEPASLGTIDVYYLLHFLAS